MSWICWLALSVESAVSSSTRGSIFQQQQQRRSLTRNSDRTAGIGASTPSPPGLELQVLPVNAAGMPCEDSSLVEQSGTKCSLLAKNIGPLGCERVLSDLAAERGRSLENIPPAFRNRRVADACPFSCGLCSTCAPGCTKWFIGNGWCEEACNNAACQFDGGDCWEKDCVVSAWSEWSECSKKCSTSSTDNSSNLSFQTRTREILIHPTPGGKACPKDLEEKRFGCNEDIECPVDCQVSPWSRWSECDAECGQGRRQRSRKVLVEPRSGGNQCPTLVQEQPCIERECEAQCEVSEWSDWSACSQPCGEGGVQIRSRHIIRGGRDCPNLVEERNCPNLVPCDVSNVCQPSAWSEWSECTSSCGQGGVMTRERVLLKGTEENCPEVTLVDQVSCNTHPCPQDCEMSEWSPWSECQSVCGEGVKTRTRSVLKPAGPGGIVCGPTTQTQQCFNKPCRQDCIVSAWSEWSSCKTSGSCGVGTQVRQRHVIAFPDQGGESCPRLSEFRDCSIPCNSIAPGGASDRNLNEEFNPKVCVHVKDQWTDWSSCDAACFTESQAQERHMLIAIWTPDCEELVQEKPCDCSTKDKDEFCILSEWSKWTECSVACGGGYRKRFRHKIQDGDKCPFALEESEPCGSYDCPNEPCSLSPWSEWSECSVSCGVGTSVRTRYLVNGPSDLSAKCGTLEQVSACATDSCDRDCVLSDWSLWSECTQRCGGGKRRKTRQILIPPAGNGKVCSSLAEEEDCNMQPCDSDCLLSDWSEWSPCEGECGLPGTQTRSRTVLKPQIGRGLPCSRRLTESRTCERSCSDRELRQAQVKANCQTTAWSDWSECAGQCQEGTQTRHRTILSGSPFICGPETQTVPCTLPPCKKDCQVGSWSEWSECSVDCGGGERWRSREIVNEPSGGGEICPALWESEVCNIQPCKGDDCLLSDWSGWSECTKPCGGGVKERTRSVVIPPTGSGAQCESLKEVRGCNLQRCPGEICRDNPQIEASGITCAMLKTQGCQTNLQELARKHGVTLPTKDIPPEARIQDACPETCGVCEECAPGCELRDLGNTVCTEECNNEQCQHDLGDCGADCSLDMLKGTAWKISSVASAIRIDDKIMLTCPANSRVKGHESINSVEAICTSDKEVVVPELGFVRVEDTTCIEDACPFVSISSEDYPLFNGVYHRDAIGYAKQVGLRTVRLSTRADNAGSLRYFLSYPISNNQGSSDTLVELVSSPCSSLKPTIMCHNGVWYESQGFSRADASVMVMSDQLPSPIDIQCRTTGPSSLSNPSLRTHLKTGSNSAVPLPCEDVKLVEQVAGFTCQSLISSLGCGYMLADAGRPLPPILPTDATVGFVCPASCGMCSEESCAPGCTDWFLSNGFCDEACNVKECAFDGGDCIVHAEKPEPERELGVDSTQVAQVTTSAAYQGTRGVDAENCADDPIVGEMGFSCQLLYLASQLKSGCTETIIGLAESQGINVSLPSGVPADTRVLDACPVTCKACSEVRYLKKPAPSFELQPVDYDAVGCSDNDELVKTYASLTCGEIAHLLSDCSLSVASLGYLPEGVPEGLTLETLCPLSCKACKNPRAERYKCHDFTILQTLSGFSCQQAVGLLGVATCQKPINSFGYELPAALPSTLVLGDLCGESCGLCDQTNNLAETDDSEVAVAAGSNCVDDAFVYDTTGSECYNFVTMKGVRCGDAFIDLGYELPKNVPSTATVSQACPVSCNACRAETEAVCQDSLMVPQVLNLSCKDLKDQGSCATPVSQVSAKAGALGILSTLSVGELCRQTCGRCVAKSATSSSHCEDHSGIAYAGFSCDSVVRYAESGCSTPLSNLFGRQLLPVPDMALVQDACPKTCRVCVQAGEQTPVQPVCEDSSLLSAVNFDCDQILQLAGGGGAGCTTSLYDIAGSTSFGSMLPQSLAVKDLCKRTCKQCGLYTCQDGFQNGFEEYIDCGGKDCRECNSCQAFDLKRLGDHMITVGSFGSTFVHGSTREVTCKPGYHYTHSNNVITCRDGVWTDPKGKCEEDTIEIWRTTVGFTHGQDFMHDFVQNLAEGLEVTFGLVTDSIDSADIRILRAGSCAAITASGSSGGECEDNPLVEQTGFGCEMLAGFGCGNILAELAATAGVSMPAGIPAEATISDACPKTCDTCEEAAKRMAEFSAETSSDGLGTDCFKADVGINTKLNLPNLLNATLGRVEHVERILLAAVKDSIASHNTTIMTTWLAGSAVKTEHRHLMTATDYINGRPVSLLLSSPMSDSSSFALESSSDSAASSDLAPIEMKNVSLSVWENGVSVTGGLEAARGVFVSGGLKPSFAFLDIGKILDSLEPPAVGVTASQIVDAESISLIDGHFYQAADSGIGSMLDSSLLTNVAACGERDSEEDSCCAIRQEFITYIQGECGMWMMGEKTSEEELQHLCLVSGPVNELETGSCYYRLKRILQKYKSQGKSTCLAAQLINDIADSWCHKGQDGSYCMTHFEEDMADFTMTSFSLKLSEDLDVICAPNSCSRNHVKYLHALVHLNVAWGMQTHFAQPSTVRRSLLQIQGWNTELATLGHRLRDNWTIHGAKSYSLNDSEMSLEEKAEALSRLRNLYGESGLKRSRKLIAENPEELLPLNRAGDDILDLVCFKPFGGYCQHTLQLLSTANPIDDTSIPVPCTSSCLSPTMVKLGAIVEKQGRAISYPKHAVLGAAIGSFGKYACQRPALSITANNTASYCHELYSPPINWSPNLLDVNRGDPPFNANDCQCSTIFLGDGACDPKCFSAQCAYDGGDCFTESMFPTFISSLLGALCASSINDPCLPLNNNFQCSEKCRSQIQQCVAKNGCCYAGALDTLKSMVDAEMSVHKKVFEATSVKVPQSNGLTSILGGVPQSQGFTPLFSTDWSFASLEQQCGISLDRTCTNGDKSNEFILTIDLANFNLTNSSPLSASLRVLQSSNDPDLSSESSLAIESINEWLRSSTTRNKLAAIFSMVPEDIYRVWLQPVNDDSSALIIHSRPGNDYTSVNGLRSFTTADASQHILPLINQAPGINDLRFTRPIAVRDVTLADQTFLPDKAGKTYAKKDIAGAWGFEDTSRLTMEGCTATALQKMLQRTQIVSSKDKQHYDHGDQVITSCAAGYVQTSQNLSNGVWQCVAGVWIRATPKFSCDLPCPNDVIQNLGLSASDVRLQPIDGNPDVCLADLPPWATLKPSSTQKYMPGDAVLIACREDLTIDMSAGHLGVVTSVCQNGQWSAVSLECQPACAAVPWFATEQPNAYTMMGSDTIFGATRNVSCAESYFANPPNYEGQYEMIKCEAQGKWAAPTFRCVLGLTVDPSGMPSTVQKMLKTLFSRTGVISLVAFGTVATLAVIAISLFWIFLYKKRADVAYIERKRMLQEYLSSAVTSSGEGGTMGEIRSSPPIAPQSVPLNRPLIEGWEGRSPSSSTVSAFRRISMLRDGR